MVACVFRLRVWKRVMTKRRSVVTLLRCWCILLVVGIPAGLHAADDAESFFEAKIRPVLIKHCLKCHGGEQTSQGFSVRSRDLLLQGGETGPAIVAGDPDKSLLLKAITYDGDLQMPPDDPLPQHVVANFRRWIKQGAVWPKAHATISAENQEARHWAFHPLKTVPLPNATAWSGHPIDRFVADRWKQHELVPVAPATSRALIRRVTFDLIGLPPSPAEVAEFVDAWSGDSQRAYKELIERLLASQHYGERWGRHWMDVVRYADTAGDNADYPIPEIHKYRDYIIDAFNNDMPYDQFVREQLAGDLLAKANPDDRYAEQVVATGFLALSRRYATAPYELWHLTLEDSIETVGRSFLGLTLRCARCHDHKFDPITREDYYALYGIFASTKYPWAGGEEFKSKGFDRMSFVPLLPPKLAEPQMAAYRTQLEELKQQIGTTADEKQKGELQQKLHQLKKPGLPPELAGAYAVTDDKPVDVPLHQQGDPASPGVVVKRGLPSFLNETHPAIPSDQSGRRQLAEWIARADNPLTARVMVNRIWQHHFGKGIVATPSNFGLRGAAPTHPELLDYLAGKFIESGWSVKAMHRLILSSKTYQLEAIDHAQNRARDESNRWYWRSPRRRLDAESLRDAILIVSGELETARPGRHPFPAIHDWGWTQHDAFKEVYASNHRSVYLMTQRLKRHPFLGLFDGPDTNTTTARRSESTVPPQSLFLMNNPWVKVQAEKFAERLIAGSPKPAARIEKAYQLAFGRPPNAAEISHARTYVRAYAEQLAGESAPPERVKTEAWTSFARILMSANEFLYVD